MTKVIRGGKYQHYKGKYYQVIGLGRIEATLEEVVIYKPLYKITVYPEDTLWVRPIEVFLEEVTVEGKKMPRFKLIKENL